ncbi:MAG: substrate-binding domain-containing protein [Desulfurococcales archaeon]|nr:substrate-binding domain-containing protein [Desulfurococcales archaeon]
MARRMLANLNYTLPLALIVIVAVLAASYILKPGEVELRVSTTTSLYNTGLLDYIANEFSKENPRVFVEFIAVGTGEALKRAERGDACLALVHAPSLEREYIEKGVLGEGRIIAYNYFIIAGPPSDPAKVRDASSAAEAFRRIAEAGARGEAVFVSRGDNSGTHVKEMSLWKLAGVTPRGEWYKESGQGMAQTLVIASELGAYTLSDIGTYLKLKAEGRLPGIVELYHNSSELLNIYSAYLVSSCTGEEADAAKEFMDFLWERQDLIASYGVEEYGQPLFYPAKDRLDWLEEEWSRLARG